MLLSYLLPFIFLTLLFLNSINSHSFPLVLHIPCSSLLFVHPFYLSLSLFYLSYTLTTASLQCPLQPLFFNSSFMLYLFYTYSLYTLHFFLSLVPLLKVFLPSFPCFTFCILPSFLLSSFQSLHFSFLFFSLPFLSSVLPLSHSLMPFTSPPSSPSSLPLPALASQLFCFMKVKCKR